MCIMFRDKWIILFFKFPFCGDFSLHLHKMVQETSRNITQAENLQRHVFWNSLMLTSIYRACWMGENTELCTRYRQKQTPETLTWATLVCSTQSPNLVSNSSYFPQVSLCQTPGWDVPVKLWTCVQNSRSAYFCPCLLYPQYPNFRPPKWRVLH